MWFALGVIFSLMLECFHFRGQLYPFSPHETKNNQKVILGWNLGDLSPHATHISPVIAYDTVIVHVIAFVIVIGYVIVFVFVNVYEYVNVFVNVYVDFLCRLFLHQTPAYQSNKPPYSRQSSQSDISFCFLYLSVSFFSVSTYILSI